MKLTPIRAALLLSLSAASLSAVAHPNSIGYAYDSQSVVVRDNYGNCVRTAEWTKENAIKECDASVAEKPAAAPVAAPAPAPVPAPVVIAPTPAPKPAPAPIKIDLSADNSFDSAKSVLKPEGQATLDKLAADLNGVTYDRITVVGHADRKGAAAANQKLSVDRANSVKSYLVSKGVPAGKIDATGKGSSEPVTKADDCKKLNGAKLSACLSPDRRVSIRVSGTKLK